MKIDFFQLFLLALHHIIQLYIQIFHDSIQFLFEESFYCLLVKKLTESIYYWTEHYFTDIDVVNIALSNLPSQNQSSALYEVLYAFVFKLSVTYQDKFHILSIFNLKPNKNIIDRIKQLLLLNSSDMLALIKKHIEKSENQKQKKKKAYMPLWGVEPTTFL
jgi:hypothetical protein